MPIIKRNFISYFLLTVATITLGLFSRSQSIPLPDFISTYAGDTLWALMVFWGLCVVFPRAPTRYLFIAAIIFSFLVEFSQLYQAPWINDIRSTTLGGLVLGYGFKFSDLVCYLVGISSGAIVDFLLLNYFISTPNTTSK